MTDLGARPAADEVARLLAPAALPDGLTAREAEVLRLVASGRSNTADRRRPGPQREDGGPAPEQHLPKIEVGSRTAAAAYAFEHGLA